MLNLHNGAHPTCVTPAGRNSIRSLMTSAVFGGARSAPLNFMRRRRTQDCPVRDALLALNLPRETTGMESVG